MYSFNAVTPEYSKNNKMYIELPFNVWEVFSKKGAMKVKGSINGCSYECSLIPRGNGVYLLPISQKIIKQSKIAIGDILHIIMERIDDKLNEESKGNVGGIDLMRKIDSVNYVQQPNSAACGQACIAMLAGANVQEVIKVMHTSGPTSIGQLIEALDYYHIKHAERNTRISKKNPQHSEICILTVHMPTYSHWALYFKGKYYDPEFGALDECHPDGKITSFLEIRM